MVFGHKRFSVGPHDDFVPVIVDVALAKGHRLSQDVEAGTNQVNVEHLMVLNQAEDTFVVVTSALGTKGDDNALRTVCLNGSFSN